MTRQTSRSRSVSRACANSASSRAVAFFVAIALVPTAFAASVPYQFRPGAPAKAAEVNANFSALVDAVTVVEGKTSTLEGKTSTLENEADALAASVETRASALEDRADGQDATNTALLAAIASLQQRVATLEGAPPTTATVAGRYHGSISGTGIVYERSLEDNGETDEDGAEVKNQIIDVTLELFGNGTGTFTASLSVYKLRTDAEGLTLGFVNPHNRTPLASDVTWTISDGRIAIAILNKALLPIMGNTMLLTPALGTPILFSTLVLNEVCRLSEAPVTGCGNETGVPTGEPPFENPVAVRESSITLNGRWIKQN